MLDQTISLQTAGGRHRLRVTVSGRQQSIYLDEALCVCHRAKPANGCAVYVIAVDDEKAEVFLHLEKNHWVARAYLNDEPVAREDTLTLSQTLDNLVTASAVSFGQYLSGVWRQVLLHWGVWAVVFTVITCLISGYPAVGWAVVGGISVLAIPLCGAVECCIEYRGVRRLQAPEDAYQHPEAVESMVS